MPGTDYSFGTFRIDTTERLLHCGSEPVPLTPKAIETLLVLLENHPRLVTKEELMSAVWPDTAVEENSLTRNIYLLRKALGNEPQGDTYIETIPRRGYRFRGELQVTESTPGKFPAGIPPSSPQAPPRAWWARLGWIGVVAAIAAGVWAVAVPRPKSSQPVRFRPLTASSTTLSVTGSVLSPDGRYLAYSDATGTYLKNLDTADLSRLATPPGLRLDPRSWFPDGSKLLARAAEPETGLWILTVVGTAPPRQIRGDVSLAAVAPDGMSIAFTNRAGSELWVMRPDGSEPRCLARAAGLESFDAPSWYPGTHRLAVVKSHKAEGELISEMDTIDVDANRAARAWAGDGAIAMVALPGGRTILSRLESLGAQTSNLWEFDVDTATGRVEGRARQITDRAGRAIYQLSASADGRRLAFLEFTAAHNIQVAETDGAGLSGQRRLTLDNRDDYPHAWTPDGKTVMFESNRSGNWDIFRQALDQPFAEPVVATRAAETQARISPDGAWLLFVRDSRQPSASSLLKRQRLAGGPEEDVMPMGPNAGYRCSGPAGNVCVIADRKDRFLEFTAFDPLRGRIRQVGHADLAAGEVSDWDLSGDGKSIVLAIKADGPAQLRILPLGEGSPRDVAFREWPYLRTINWRADGSGWFGATLSGADVVLVTLDKAGTSRVLWKAATSFYPWAIPSPDGRHVAFPVYTSHFEAWMMENF